MTPRPLRPTFLMSGPAGTVIGRGIATRHASLAEARRWLTQPTASADTSIADTPTADTSSTVTPRADSSLADADPVRVLCVALPFHAHEAPTIFSPAQWEEAPAGEALPASLRKDRDPWPAVSEVRAIPEPEEHCVRVAALRDRIIAGECAKIVASRALEVTWDRPIDPLALWERLGADGAAGADRANHAADVHAQPGHRQLCQLGPGRWLVGASPELLLAQRGELISSHPLAGTAPRHRDPVRDRAAAIELRCSRKDLQEHAFVPAAIEEVLRPHCRSLSVPAEPDLTATRDTWHLGTPILGRLRADAPHILDLLAELHPTPAVGGSPRDRAARILADAEPARAFFGGAVGWVSSAGEAEFRVIIRSCQIDGRRTRIDAGGGIVATSNPWEELRETALKLQPMLRALGIADADPAPVAHDSPSPSPTSEKAPAHR